MIIAIAEVPDLFILGDTLSCSEPTIRLEGQTSATDATYTWEGPNGFTSTESMPIINEVGNYILEISVNGCTAKDSIMILEDILIPDIETSVNDTLDCSTPTVLITSTTLSDDLIYNWSGPNGFLSNEQNPTVNESGLYLVTITASNGCEVINNIEVIQNNDLPEIIVIGDTLDCDNGFTQLELINPVQDWTYEWTGPSNFISSESTPMIDVVGIYSLTVTASNGCSAESDIEVVQVGGITDLSIIGDTINCFQTEVNIFTISDEPDLTYNWSGPNNFTTTNANALVSEAGIYNVTVTAVSGCSATESIEVVKDILPPDLMVFNDTLTCNTMMLNLQSLSSTAITYNWSGPNGFAANTPNPTIDLPGDYLLTITGSNGCTNTRTAQILADTLSPDLLVFADTITCSQSSVTLSVISSQDNLNYEWQGPNGFSANIGNPEVMISGTYQLTVTGSNGCSNNATLEVEQDESFPFAIVNDADEITCNLQTVILDGTGSSVGDDFTYEWLNSSGEIIGTNLQVSVADSGTYTLVVNNIIKDCRITDQVTVKANTNSPEAILFPINGLTINCDFESLILSGTGSAPFGNVEFKWLDDNGLFSTEPEIEIDSIGTYTLIVLDMENGCQDTSLVEVLENTTLPLVEIETPDILTCINDVIELNGTNSSDGNLFTYQWTTNNTSGFLEGDTSLRAKVESAGFYTLVITNEENACIDSAQVEVLADQESPLAEAGEGGELDCLTTELELNGIASAEGAPIELLWSGPGILSGASSLNPIVDAPGAYNFLVTNLSNGCTAFDEVVITENTNAPTGALIDLTLPTCFGDDDASIQIDSVIGGVGPYLFAFEEFPYTDISLLQYLPSGNYTLSIQDMVGCEWDTLITINDPIELIVDLGPDLTIELGDSIPLEGLINIPIAEVDTFIWSTNNYLNCTDCLDPISFPTEEINYTLTVFNDKGCVASDEISITLDKLRLVYIPNAFSPDNNGRNDEMMIYGGKDVKEIKAFKIFDRWGELVFEDYDFQPNDPAHSWKGTLNGQALNPAVFVYYAEIEFIDNRVEIYQGDITLLR